MWYTNLDIISCTLQVHGSSHMYSYNVLGIWIYVGQTKCYLDVGSKKHNMHACPS